MTLSYVWGEYSTPRDTIQCNDGTAIAITTNCRDALIALRKRYGRLTIWIDAICINQQDIEEKSKQIQLMEEIYSWSERVVVWLGPGDKSSRKAIVWMRRAAYGSFFGAFMQIATTPVSKQRSRYKFALIGRIMWCAIRDSLSAIGSLIPIWYCLRKQAWKVPKKDVEDLFDREWFDRAWTFQELLLAWNITIACGDNALDWGHLLGALQYCHESSETHDWFYTDSGLKGKGLRAIRELVSSWMNISRPTHWNGQEIRRALPDGDDSAESYQRAAERLVVRPRIGILNVWYWSVSALLFSNAAFLIILLLVVVPIWATLGLKWAKLTVVLDAAFSIVVGIHYLGPDPSGTITKRCHFRLGFGSPDVDAVAVHLSSIVRVIRERKVSEPRDRSYATHGVLRRLGLPLTSADYKKSLGEVYQDFFTDLLRWEPCLISLILDVDRDAFPDSPSWTPNWDALGSSSARPEYVMDLEFQDRPANSISIDGSRLHVSVVCKELAIKVSSTFQTMDSDLFMSDAEYFAWTWGQVLLLSQWMSLFCPKAPVEDRRPKRKIRRRRSFILPITRIYDANIACVALDADPNPAENSRFDGNKDDYDNWVRLVNSVLPGFVSIDESNISTPFEATQDFIRSNYVGLSSHGNIKNIERNASTHRGAVKVMVETINRLSVLKRRLFSTTSGVPGSVSCNVDLREGDLVAKIEGVYWPLVLRRTDAAVEEYKVLGYAIVPWRSGFDIKGECAEKLVLV